MTPEQQKLVDSKLYTRKPEGEASLAAPSCSAVLVRRLQALYNELKVEEMGFHKKGNDEAECATYAAAERLKEVVKDFIAENLAAKNPSQPTIDERLTHIERLLVEVVAILAGSAPNKHLE